MRTIVNIIEPDHGIILDPACGSTGMFVQTGHFIEDVRHQHTHEINISFYGQEKTDLNSKLARMNLALKAALAATEARHKAWLKLLELAEKQLRARQWPKFSADSVKEAKKALQHRDVRKREQPTVRDKLVEALKRTSYFIAQGHWLLSRFPDGRYIDVPGLCKAVNRAEIAANDYSLTPGRYVGVALGGLDDDDGEAFVKRMKEIHNDLAELNDKAIALAARISSNFEELLG